MKQIKSDGIQDNVVQLVGKGAMNSIRIFIADLN